MVTEFTLNLTQNIGREAQGTFMEYITKKCKELIRNEQTLTKTIHEKMGTIPS
jgi:hypothetical protein